MSRPFSYNDENFTVIGNILFVHCYALNIKKGEKIVEIPPAIYNRLTEVTMQGYFGSIETSSSNNSYSVSLYIIEDNNKHYIASKLSVDGYF